MSPLLTTERTFLTLSQPLIHCSHAHDSHLILSCLNYEYADQREPVSQYQHLLENEYSLEQNT
jgi:hypothetical protein